MADHGRSELSIGNRAPLGTRRGDAASFFDQFARQFERAAGDHTATRRFRIAGCVVEMRFAGDALVGPLSAAFAHLEIDAGPPADLTVLLYDTESTGVGRPPAPWRPAQRREGGMVDGFSDDPFTTIFEPWQGSLAMVDLDQRAAIFWLADPAVLRTPARAAPLRKLLHSYFASKQMSVVHAGAVGNSEGGVLIAGQSGAGKSSTALACVTSPLPLRYVADDNCVVVPPDPEAGSGPWVHSLYCTGKAHARERERFPALAPALANSADLEREKAIYFLHPTFATELIDGFPLKAVLVPRVAADSETTLAATSRLTALTALAPTSVHIAPHGHQSIVRRLGDTVRALPTFELGLGRNAHRAPGLIAELLDRLCK